MFASLALRRGLTSVIAATCALGWVTSGLAGCADRVAAPPTVVASLYPLSYVAAAVAGDAADVTTVASGAVEPHDQELTAKQRAALADATIALYIKGLSPSVDSALLGADNAVDAGEAIGARVRQGDPHLWLNPLLLAEVGSELAMRLSNVDSDHSDIYRRNATLFTQRMTKLDESIRRATGQCENRVLVTTHGAFAYFAGRYQFRQVNILGINPESQPSPATIGRIVKLVKAEDVRSIYKEAGVSDPVADTVGAETGAKVRGLYPIEVHGDADYVEMMERNRDAVVAGQVCRPVRVIPGPSQATPDAVQSPVVQ